MSGGDEFWSYFGEEYDDDEREESREDGKQEADVRGIDMKEGNGANDEVEDIDEHVSEEEGYEEHAWLIEEFECCSCGSGLVSFELGDLVCAESEDCGFGSAE